MSLTDRQQRILELAKYVWDHQHEYSLDTVDGTFYWRGCRHQLVDPLMERAKRDPGDAGGRLSALIPGFGMYQGKHPIASANRIPMRDAITSVMTRVLRPRIQDEGAGLEKQGIVQARIRNADWRGAEVAEAIHRTWADYCELWPDVLTPEGSSRLGALLPEHLVMDVRLNDQRDVRLIDYSEQGDFEFAPGETRVIVGYKVDPEWDLVSSIDIEVSAPPPAKTVIAAWYDDVAIDTYGWPAHLRGANNGQDVPTAIRTWAISLLMMSGREQYDAFQDVKDALSGIKIPAHATFNSNRDQLIARVPEAGPYVKRNQGRY